MEKYVSRCFSRIVVRSTVLLGASMCLGISQAAETIETNPEYKSTGNVTLVSNYIWRGITQTFDKPALQAGGELEHRSGLYLGAWASNVSEKWVPGSNLETDIYAGYRASIGDVNADLGLVYVYYPGGNYSKALGGNVFASSSPNTAEASLGLTYKILSVKYGRTLTPFYGWAVNNSAPGVFSSVDSTAGVNGSTRGSQYGEVSLKQDLDDGWGISGLAGHQWIANSTHLDWSYFRLGISKSISGGWGAALFYSWTTNPPAFQSYGSLTGNGQTANVASSKVFLSITRDF